MLYFATKSNFSVVLIIKSFCFFTGGFFYLIKLSKIFIMKNILLFSMILMCLVACHKKYEEKAGSFTGYEVYLKVPYDNQSDTLDYNIQVATYALVYDKGDKSYTVSGNTGSVPALKFDREDFKENIVDKVNLLS